MNMINQIAALAKKEEGINRAIAVAKAAVAVLNENGISATLTIRKGRKPKKVGSRGGPGLPGRAGKAARKNPKMGVRRRSDGVPESYLMDEEGVENDEVPAIRDEVPAIRDEEVYGDIGDEPEASDHSIDPSQLSDAARAGIR